jgi:hypothetical protein
MQEPAQHNNQMLLAFKKRQIIGCCIFSVLKTPDGIALLLRKQFVKWSQREYFCILKN